jgi:hypothetical protein
VEEVALVRLSDDVRREVCLEFGVFLGDPASCGTHDLGWSGLVEEGERGVVCWEEAEPTDAEQRRTGRGCNANRSLISVFVLLEGPFGSDSRLCVVKRQEGRANLLCQLRRYTLASSWFADWTLG